MPRPANKDESRRRAARIRAARAYAGLTQRELAAKVGVSLATMIRMESGERPISQDELLNVAEGCEVPDRFLLRGFEALTNVDVDRDLHDRVDAIEAQLRRIFDS